MDRDYILEDIKRTVSITTGVDRLEVDKVINSSFKGLNHFLNDGVTRVKIPYMGIFRLKKNLQTLNEEDDN